MKLRSVLVMSCLIAVGNTWGQTTTVLAPVTPIQHVVVILDENNSFDHYFGTYPRALNPDGEPAFNALPGTPKVNGLTPALLTNNPNSVQPFRLDRSQEVTCDNDNHYADEQKAYDSGLLDKFPESTSAASTAAAPCPTGLNMGYYDGNTVTALWNYAQHFAMSDNFFDTEFGTTVMGHLNLISGQTHTTSVMTINNKVANGSIIANVEAGFDDCVTTTTGTPVQMTGKNIGDLLNGQGISWGWFYAEFPQSIVQPFPLTACPSTYNSHYDPFQYYKSTSNVHHMPPSSASVIGTAMDQANHNYTVNDFWTAANSGHLPAVSFLKPAKAQTGHPADSTPLQEQQFLVTTINALMQLPEWSNMAIMISYDDSDGWYDHVMPPIVNQSNDPAQDFLGGKAMCGTPATGAYLDRCGYGTRLPFLVISPYAKQNYVSHELTDLTSITRFIEDNWNLGRIGDQSFDALAGSPLDLFDFAGAKRAKKVFLNPTTGEVSGKK
jgi:phospholipase C